MKKKMSLAVLSLSKQMNFSGRLKNKSNMLINK